MVGAAPSLGVVGQLIAYAVTQLRHAEHLHTTYAALADDFEHLPVVGVERLGADARGPIPRAVSRTLTARTPCEVSHVRPCVRCDAARGVRRAASLIMESFFEYVRLVNRSWWYVEKPCALCRPVVAQLLRICLWSLATSVFALSVPNALPLES